MIPDLELSMVNDLDKSYTPTNSVQGFEGFRIVTLDSGEVMDHCINNAMHLIMMIDGTAKIYKEGVPGYLESTDMYLLPHNLDFRLMGDRNCKFLHFAFYMLPESILRYLQKVCDGHHSIHYNPNNYLEQNHLMQSFLQSIQVALEGNNSFVLTARYMKLKAYELFHLILTSYNKESLRRFFTPVIDSKTDFRNFLFENYAKVKSVHELIDLSGLSRTKFYRRFNGEMGMSVYHWMQLQKARTIRDAASEPGMTVATLRSRFEFVSPGNFVRYCRTYFGCTPLQLIRRCAAGIHVPIVG